MCSDPDQTERTCGSVRSVCAAGGVEVVDSCKVSSILNRVFRANVYVCCWFC